MSERDGETLSFEHARFGRIEVPAKELLRFEPLPGFAGAERYALMAHDRGGVFAWLVSLDDPELAFVVTDPLQFFPDYAPQVGASVRERLGAKPDAPLHVLCLVVLDGGRPSLNLAAPLVVCEASRKGLQLLLEDLTLPTRQPLPAPAARPPASAAAAQTESKPPR